MVEGWRAELGLEIEPNLGATSYPGYEPIAFWGDNELLSQILAEGSDLYTRRIN
jgi:hypothetical protein